MVLAGIMIYPAKFEHLHVQVPSAMVHLLLQKHADVKIVDWLYMQQAALSSSVIKCYKAVGSLPA